MLGFTACGKWTIRIDLCQGTTLQLAENDAPALDLYQGTASAVPQSV